jgi:hypothetical protein
MELLNTLTAERANSFGVVFVTTDGMTYSYHVDTLASVIELVESAKKVISVEVTAQRDNNYKTLSVDELRSAIYLHNNPLSIAI